MDKYSVVEEKDVCPCNSGKTYGECCTNKKFKYLKDENGEIYTSIPVNEELEELFKRMNEQFSYYYGRKMKENDFAFAGIPNYRDTFTSESIKAARAAGLDERYIYAFYMTGLMPTESNVNHIPDVLLDEYEHYCEEFEELMAEDFDDTKGVNVTKFVMISNSILSEKIDDLEEALFYVFNDFIKRHSDEIVIENYVINNELDYLQFLALKAAMLVSGAKKFKEDSVPEIIYSLSRGVFENYLYIYNVNADEKFFSNYMFPKIDDVNYEFATYPDGKVNYNSMISKKTGKIKRVKISIFDLSKKLKLKEDREIYDMFYRVASRHVHIDVLSADSYFATYNPYLEINRTYIAMIILYTLATMVLKEITKNRMVQEQFKTDAKHLLGILTEDLLTCLMLINGDEENFSELNELFFRRAQLLSK